MYCQDFEATLHTRIITCSDLEQSLFLQLHKSRMDTIFQEMAITWFTISLLQL